MRLGLTKLMFLAFLAGGLAARAENPTVQARFDKSLREVRSIPKVEIQFLDTLCITDPDLLKQLKVNGATFTRTFRYTYVCSCSAAGGKYRAVSTLVSGTETNLVKQSESAYDGKTYANYSQGRLVVGSHRRGPSEGESSLNPLVAPFLWVRKDAEDDPRHILHFTDLFAPGLTNGLILPGGQGTNGVIEISAEEPVAGKPPTRFKLVLDQAGDSFTPKEMDTIAPGRGLETDERFFDYTNLGAYPYPARIEWVMTKYPPTAPPTLLATGTVMLISARLPDVIDDSQFRLGQEAEMADFIWDSDHNQFVREAPQYRNRKAMAAANERSKIYDETADGSKQIAEALAVAGQEGKDVLLLFGANNCGWCHRLHAFFETNQVVASELSRSYLVVMIDRNKDHNLAVETKYGNPSRFGLPAMVVLDGRGRQLTTQETGKLEEGDDYSQEKMMAFLDKWARTKR